MTHFANSYDDIAATLAVCREGGIVPELGVMDIGFISNAVALRDDGLLPARPWFLLELDSPAFGHGRQVAPATPANYDFLAGLLREHFPGAAWVGHGLDRPTYAVVGRALATGAHARVGFEDAIVLPDGRPARSNADLVAWAVAAARRAGREPATPAEARAIIAGGA
jgi:3-keto-5-aminohexanoate cleavage enzyme